MRHERKNVNLVHRNHRSNIRSISATVLFSSLCLLFCLCLFLISPCNAETVAEIKPVNTPQGAVIFIIDGLGSGYVYPEATPYAIDGSVLNKAEPQNMLAIFNQSCRILDVTAPQTFTEGGHSVIVTGYSQADSSIAGAAGTTIYDVAHDNGYMTFAIMENGDSWGICKKQDVIIHDEDNSVTEPEIVTEINGLYGSDKNISLAVADMVQEKASGMQSILDKYPEGSQERYNAYNIWAIETGTALIDFMNREYPDTKYILTINSGAIDSAGHYKKNSGYIAGIEGIDNATLELYETCLENNMAFILTSDHGMAFSTSSSRGGHQSEKYSEMPESQKVPLVIYAADVNPCLLEGDFGQEDIAPTILEILNLPGELRAADGKPIPVKDYVNLRVEVPETGKLILISDENIVYQNTVTDIASLMGLEQDTDYIIKFAPISDPGNEIEKLINMDASRIISMKEQSTSNKSYYNTRYIAGGILILIVNLVGLFMIRKVLKS